MGKAKHIKSVCQAWWHTPFNPSIQEAEASGVEASLVFIEQVPG